MCKLIVGIKQDNSELETIKKAVSIQRDDLYKEKDGMAAFILDKDNNITTCKDLDDYDKVLRWFYKNLPIAKVFGLHTRTATDGTVTEDNIHYFKHRKVYFAHNGIISECSTPYSSKYNANYQSKYIDDSAGFVNSYKKDNVIDYSSFEGRNGGLFDDDDLPEGCENWTEKEWRDYYSTQDEWEEYSEDEKAAIEMIESDYQREKNKKKNKHKEKNKDKSDSFIFVDKIQKPITVDSLFEDMDRLDFNGVAHLTCTKENKMFLMASRNIEAHTDFKSYVLAYSYIPECDIPCITSMFNLDIEDDSSVTKLKRYTISPGIYEIDIERDINFFIK